MIVQLWILADRRVRSIGVWEIGGVGDGEHGGVGSMVKEWVG